MATSASTAANAAQKAFAECALLLDENRLLFEQNNESKCRQSTRLTVVGKAKVMSYNDIVKAQAKRDAKEDATILSISIFSTYLKAEEVSYGRRGTVSRGSADAPGILRAEMNMRHAEGSHRDIEAAHGEAERVQGVTGQMLGEKVSGTAKQRDGLQDVARGYLDDGVELLELEYQPKEG